jgi:hypothetical protein
MLAMYALAHAFTLLIDWVAALLIPGFAKDVDRLLFVVVAVETADVDEL